MRRTEFYEVAVKAGFYGLERSGMSGKKDNVRKYWEDVFIKTGVRPALESLWASIMGPQVACVLRNHGLNFPEGLGCSHSLLCIVQVCK